MKLTFNNIENPAKILDELITGGINKNSVSVEHDLVENEIIAKNLWIYCNDEDVNNVNALVANHNPIKTITPTTEETLRAKILKDNVNMQLQLAQQQKINASILSQIAKLGGTQ